MATSAILYLRDPELHATRCALCGQTVWFLILPTGNALVDVKGDELDEFVLHTCGPHVRGSVACRLAAQFTGSLPRSIREFPKGREEH